MKRKSRIVALLLSMSLIVTMLLGREPVSADEPRDTYVRAECVMDSFILPEIIDEEEAAQNRYVDRVRDMESDLSTFVFRNEDGTNTMRMFSHPVKYMDKDGVVQDIALDLKAKREGDAFLLITKSLPLSQKD